MRHAVVAVALAILGGATLLDASDRIGVYALVDKVVFEPSADNPERIQIWGAFSIATRNDRDNYEPVQRGYLYLTAASDKKLTRAEWNDLKTVAGTRGIIGFSSRFGQSLHVRAAGEPPQRPDPYVLGVGVHRIRPDRDYAPIKALTAQITR
jgi:hypothetical protein